MKKKFILSLLLSVFLFVGFSNAWETTVYCDKDTSGCSHSNLSACCSVPRLTSFTCTSEGQITVVRLTSDGSSLGGTTFNCPGVYTTSNLSRLIVGYGNSNGFTSGFYVSESDQMPVSALSPVISGLFGVFGELIPYIVYISIGILIVTVGFYAIRRLVNWVSDKINNNFRF